MCIRDRIEAQRRLRESDQRLRAVMSHSLTAVAVKDMSGRYEYVNPRFCEVFGISPEDLLGRTDQQVFSAELAAQMRERDLDTWRQDGLFESNDALALPVGTRRFRAIRFPLKDEEGVSYALCVKFAIDRPVVDD